MRSGQVARAIAHRLAEASVGTWDPAGAYTPDQTGITLKTMPASPDAVVAVTVYDVDESPDPRSVTQAWSVQIRTRAPGVPDSVDDLADDAHDALTAHHAQWGDVFVQRSHRRNFAPMGEDANRRHERVDNYHVITAR